MATCYSAVTGHICSATGTAHPIAVTTTMTAVAATPITHSRTTAMVSRRAGATNPISAAVRSAVFSGR